MKLGKRQYQIGPRCSQQAFHVFTGTIERMELNRLVGQ